ncbi:hypothetical protein [Candidatus Hamiltonella endosymbiont of Tuberolachnus salignus]|uniref:hypothetical protein n=1 Tax=Candidatus Williamhamiltonella endosymbiont of Tuberolachnus salignus TaxID=3077954 RepID=UPI0030CDD94C
MTLGEGVGSAAESNAYEIYDKPSVDSVNVPDEVQEGQPISLVYRFISNNTGSDTSTFQWEWWDEQEKVWKKSGLASNQSRSLIPDSSYSGYQVRVVITPKGSKRGIKGDLVISNSIKILPSKPEVRNVTISSRFAWGHDVPKGGLFVIVKYDFIHNNTGNDQSIFQWQYKEYSTWKDFNSIETIDSKKLQLSVTKQFLFSSQNFTSYNIRKYAPIRVRITPKGSKKQSITGTVVEKDMGCLNQLLNPASTCSL